MVAYLGEITGDLLGLCKLKGAQATSSAEEDINRLNYSAQMRAVPGKHSHRAGRALSGGIKEGLGLEGKSQP